MYVVKGNMICIMVQDSKRPTKYGYEWVYIPEKHWMKMTEKQKKRYITD